MARLSANGIKLVFGAMAQANQNVSLAVSLDLRSRALSVGSIAPKGLGAVDSAPMNHTEQISDDKYYGLQEALDYGQLDDHALMAQVKAGNQAAFDEIVQRYKNKLTNFIYGVLNDYELAIDLVQETFIRIYTSAERYQATNNFSTYIYHIAQNLAISEIRKRKRRGLFQMPFFSSDKDGDEIEIEIADNRILAPEDVMIGDERLLAVRRAIVTLPEKYRIALVLRDVEGKTYEEISAILDLSDGTVKSRINRGRTLLKEKLHEYL